jgi:hypothetical protein
MGPQQAQNGVLKVSKNDISRSVKLNQNVVSGFTLAKSQVNDTVDTQLLDLFQLFGTQMLPELHTKSRRQLFLVLNVICSVDSDSRLNDKVLLSVSS